MIAMSAASSYADLNGDGYYRVQNAVTKRYAYLLDDKGYFDPKTTSADVNALQLYSGFLKASSDPSSIFYITKVPDAKYDYNVAGQGTSIYDFLTTYLKIIDGKQYEGRKSYYAYASKSGFTKYLGDLRVDNDTEMGFPSVDAKGDNRLWYIDALVNSSSDSYFGIAPTVTAGGKYYYPFFAGFPYSAYSAGVKFYFVSRIDAELGVAVIKEVSGVVPAGTPVIVECSNPLAADNKLNIGGWSDGSAVAGNMLKGVYFDNDTKTHYNRTAYDKSSMRSLASVDGKLMFVTGNYDFIPRNEAYLQLTTAEQKAVGSYQVMTESDYNAYVSSLADHNADGYYRLQNASTRRYMSLNDDKGSLGASADVNALQFFSDITRASSDPSTVFYMSKPGGDAGVLERDLATQGTNTQSVFNTHLKFAPASVFSGAQSYYVYSNPEGVARYIGDSTPAGSDWGKPSTDASGESRMWMVDQIADNSESNYFGVTPSLTAGGKYFYPFMAGFPVKALSEGVKFYTLSRIDADLEVMVLKEVSGTIPAGTPVIVECTSPLASGNRLVVGASGDEASVEGNLLSGVYFDSDVAGHQNRTPYDASMRSLAVVDGKLCFAPSQSSYVVRNQAFVRLSSELQKNVSSYTVMTESDYDAYVAEMTSVISAGYYRMQNAATSRYMSILDNKASVNTMGVSDLKAFSLVSDILRASSDPASVLLLSDGPASGSAIDHDLSAQSTSVYKMLSSYVKVLPAGGGDGKSAFSAYVVKNNEKKYFGDSASASSSESVLSFDAQGDASSWYFEPVDCESESSYFGVVPSVTADGKYYAAFMASFPFEPYSEGMKVYGITKIDAAKKAMVMTEYEGVIPAGTPVIIECAGPLASDNKLAIGDGENKADVKSNRLKGVWFDFDSDGRTNTTAFDKESMRVLTAAEGKLAFAKADLNTVPRNQAYMPVSGIRQLEIDEYMAMTWDEYESIGGDVATVIPESEIVDVFTMDGVLVKSGVVKSEISGLGSGVYLLRSAESTEKYIVK